MVFQHCSNRSPFTQGLETSWKTGEIGEVGEVIRVVYAVVIDVAYIVVLHLPRTPSASPPECLNCRLIRPQPISRAVNATTNFLGMLPPGFGIDYRYLFVDLSRNPPGILRHPVQQLFDICS